MVLPSFLFLFSLSCFLLLLGFPVLCFFSFLWLSSLPLRDESNACTCALSTLSRFNLMHEGFMTDDRYDDWWKNGLGRVAQ